MGKKVSGKNGVDPQDSWYETTPSASDEELNEFFVDAVKVFGAEKLLADHAAGVRSETGTNNAKRRLELDKDGKQAALLKVRTHWQEWQNDKSIYKGKAAFARDMVDAYPVLISTKYIEDLCRKFENESVKKQ